MLELLSLCHKKTSAKHVDDKNCTHERCQTLDTRATSWKSWWQKQHFKSLAVVRIVKFFPCLICGLCIADNIFRPKLLSPHLIACLVAREKKAESPWQKKSKSRWKEKSESSDGSAFVRKFIYDIFLPSTKSSSGINKDLNQRRSDRVVVLKFRSKKRRFYERRKKLLKKRFRLMQ